MEARGKSVPSPQGQTQGPAVCWETWLRLVSLRGWFLSCPVLAKSSEAQPLFYTLTIHFLLLALPVHLLFTFSSTFQEALDTSLVTRRFVDWAFHAKWLTASSDPPFQEVCAHSSPGHCSAAMDVSILCGLDFMWCF